VSSDGIAGGSCYGNRAHDAGSLEFSLEAQFGYQFKAQLELELEPLLGCDSSGVTARRLGDGARRIDQIKFIGTSRT